MSIRFRKSAGIAAILASATLALPAQAASFQTPATAAVGHWSVADETAHGWRSRGGWGGYYGRGWGGRGHVRGGDVLAGILIVGGALAVVKAIGDSNERRYRDSDYRDRDDRYRDYRNSYPDARYPDARYPDARYPDYRDQARGYRQPGDSRNDDARRGIDGAIEDCVGEVQRDTRVATVDTAERNDDGWRVAGDLVRGGRYACKFGNDGRVRDIDIDMKGDRASSSSRYERGYEMSRDAAGAEDRGGDARYDDDYYASARERIGEQRPDLRNGDAPFTGEEPDMAAPAEDGDRNWQRGEADDRYETAAADDYALARK